jgi:hypothetical protein
MTMASVEAPARFFQSMIEPTLLASSHLPNYQRSLSVKVCS